MKTLVTGASGFIGQSLCSNLLAQDHEVRAAVRFADSIPSVKGFDVVEVGEVGAQTDWSSALAGVDCVFHCAARAHVIHETDVDSLAAYRAVNVEGTLRLAEQAAALNVQRFVFLSSVKVNGEQTKLGAPFLLSDVPAPEDPYGVSKWEAEQALWSVSAQTGLEVVVVRPPLVYGPGVKGNLLRLLRWVARGVPLPLQSVHNQRSLVGLSNLVDLLLRFAEHPNAAGHTFLVSDGHDLSTPQLIRLMAEGMNQPARLLPVPVALLQVGGSLLSKRDEVERLVGSLQVDSRHNQALFIWTPRLSVEDGVREMARWYARSHDVRAR
ncbi:SDR family oxidoreductase [Alphaproteobacteria bacterium]|nr:SDR family oxidoreductase [Alphaproteobacteria bacterium]